MTLKHLEEILDHSSHSKCLLEEGDSGGIWNFDHHSKTHKPLEGAPFINLKFQLFIAAVEKLLENEHLEKDQRVNPLGPCVIFPLKYIALIK